MGLNKLKEELDYMCFKGVVDDYSLTRTYENEYSLKVYHCLDYKCFSVLVRFDCEDFNVNEIIQQVKLTMGRNYIDHLDQCLEREGLEYED